MADSVSQAAEAAVLFPDGKVRRIPNSEVQSALSDGGQLAIPVRFPDKLRWIPAREVGEAFKDNGKVEWEAVPRQHQEGFWGALGSEAWNAVKAVPGMLQAGFAATNIESAPLGGAPLDAVGSMVEGDEARKQAGYGVPYRLGAAAAEQAGANVAGMEESARQGDVGGVLGRVVAPAVAYGIGKGAARYGPKAVRAVAEPVKEAYYDKRTRAVRAVEPSAATLPPKAVFGAEKIVKGSAPVGSDPNFRASVHAATGDLAEIGRRTEAQMKAAKGGMIQPDMRPRAAVNAFTDYLKELYRTERAPQIARHGENPVVMRLSTDAREALQTLAKEAGLEADRAAIQRALESKYLPLAEVDRLAMLVNKERIPFAKMTPEQRAAAGVTSRRYAGLKALDEELGTKIADELNSRGEGGVREYERRYATLSHVRDVMRTRLNAVELQRTVPGARWVRGIFSGKAGIASASQASVSDVNIGRTIEQGLRTLGETNLRPNRPQGTGPRSGMELLMRRVNQRALPAPPQIPDQSLRSNPYGPTGRMETPISVEGIPVEPTPVPRSDYQPSLQNPRQFVGPGEIRPAPVEGNLFRELLPKPEGPLFEGPGNKSPHEFLPRAKVIMPNGRKATVVKNLVNGYVQVRFKNGSLIAIKPERLRKSH